MRSGAHRSIIAVLVICVIGTAPTLAGTTDTGANVEDTDGDGLTDDAERQNYDSDPSDPDTDDDGLGDYEEVTEFNTSPYQVDTDADRYQDGTEIDTGSDPHDPDSTPGTPDESGVPESSSLPLTIPTLGAIAVVLGLVSVRWLRDS